MSSPTKKHAGHDRGNPNRPRKGNSIRTDSIKDVEKVKRIVSMLEERGQYRDAFYVTLAVVSGTRTGDLRKLKVEQFLDKEPGDSIQIKESKTKKLAHIVITQQVYDAFWKWYNNADPPLLDDDYILRSSKCLYMALTTSYLNVMTKKWCGEVGMRGNFGVHSWRRAHGWMLRTVFKKDISVISRSFNHSSTSTTQLYLGITDEEVYAARSNFAI